MALVRCNVCGRMISDRASFCPNCGAPRNTMAPMNYQPQPSPYNRKKNSDTSWWLIGILIGAVVILALAIGLVFYNRSISRSNAAMALQNMPKATTESVNDNVKEYVVKSYGGYGLYLRTSPRDDAKTKVIYRDDTHFFGKYSDTPGWISVVKNNSVIGYLPAEKVYEASKGSHSSTIISKSELTEYVVMSYGGYGLYLRSSPRDGAKTKTVYRDDRHFFGKYSGTPGWISVVEDGHVIGYLPEEKVYEAY